MRPTFHLTPPGRGLLVGLVLLGAVTLFHRPPADVPVTPSRAGVGWCPEAGAAPMPVACVPRP